jgi:hypothetical protein
VEIKLPDIYDFESLVTIEVPVKYKGRNYIMREATGEVVARYRDRMMQSARMNADGKIQGFDRLQETEMYLLSWCLFEVNGEGGQVPVTYQHIKDWQNRVVSTLLKDLKLISEIEEPDTEESLLKERAAIDEKLAKLKEQDGTPEGNGQSVSTAGSA